MIGTIKKVLKTIAKVFLILLVTLCLYTFVVTDIMKKDYANVFGYTYFVVATGSMSGTIEVNDVVIVNITKNVKLNDIITYKDSSGEFITHRLIKRNGASLITKGDVNNAEDDPITRNNVIGKVALIISPSFVLKLLATFLILFILFALLNFDKIFKKYIVSEVKRNIKSKNKVPEAIFESSNKTSEKHTGNTVTIPIDEVVKITDSLIKEETFTAVDDIEVLELEDVIDIDNNDITRVETKTKKAYQRELLDQIVNLLRVKNNTLTTTRINKKWLIKYQYIYRLTNIIRYNDMISLHDEIEQPPFKEIYDYDLDKAGLYLNLRNKIYEMPVYVFLRILVFAILYNDDEFFDGVFKIMKYKMQVDKNNYFKSIGKNDKESIKQMNLLIDFMRKIAERFDNKNVFSLDRIEKLVKIKDYVNH